VGKAVGAAGAAGAAASGGSCAGTLVA
jgi:hypothetical protein